MTKTRTQAAAYESTHAKCKNRYSSLRYVVITWRDVWALPWSIMKHKHSIHLRNEIWYLTGVFPIFPWGSPFSACLKMEEPRKMKCMHFTYLRKRNCTVATGRTNLSDISAELQIGGIVIITEPELTVIIRCHCKQKVTCQQRGGLTAGQWQTIRMCVFV